MPTYRLIVILMFLVVVPVTTRADDKTGWALSATIGASQIKDTDGADTFSGNSFGTSFDIEYRISPNVALGFGGFSLGKADDTFGTVETEIQVRGYDIFGRAIFPVSDKAELFGRIAAANYFVDIDPGSVSIEDALFGEDAFEFGFGVDFARQDKLAFRIEARYFNGGSDETGTLLTFGINYLF